MDIHARRPPFSFQTELPLPALLAVLLFFLGLASPAAAQRPLGITGKAAPAWDLTWLNLPQEVSSLDVEDFRGSVLYVFCFQSWCPGCHSHGFPTLREVEARFRDQENVRFVAAQTVFEGHGTNTQRRALDELSDYGLEIPLAHDSSDPEGPHHGPSPFMHADRTGGTPWTILIDPEGKVAWNGFQLSPEAAIAKIESLLPADSPRP